MPLRPTHRREARASGANAARDALADAADAPFVAHATWVPARTPGMQVRADAGLVLADSGLPCDTFNLVCRARLDDATVASRVRAAVAHFREAGRPFSWWVGPADRPRALGALLEEAGLVRADGELAMAMELSAPTGAEPAPAALSIVHVRTPEALADFAAVTADNWTPPDPEVPRFYAQGAP
jgi:hypothetical protein